MPSLLKPFRKASQGLLGIADSLVPTPQTFGLLDPEQQAQARDQARLALTNSLLQASAPSLTPRSAFSTLGEALNRSQGVANQAAMQTLQAQQLPLDALLKRSQIARNLRSAGDPNATVADPSAVREFTFFEQLGREDREQDSDLPTDELTPRQQEFLNVKRAQQLQNIGQVPTVVQPGAGGRPQVTPLSTLEEEATGAAEISGAEAGAETTSREIAQQRLALPKHIADLDAAIQKQRNLLSRIESGEFSDKGAFGDDFGPVRGRVIPFTAAGQEFDALAGDFIIEKISSATFGQLSEGERKFLASTVPSRSNRDEANANIVRERLNILERERQRTEKRLESFGELSGEPSGPEQAEDTGELERRVMQLRKEVEELERANQRRTP